MSDSKRGVVFDVKEFTVHDGPGIRATVFLKGCPLACRWCHNPEGIRPQPQLMITGNGCTGCGKCRAACAHEECRGFDRCARSCPNGLLKIAGTSVSARELADRMHRLAPLLAEGGVTISGGEPLMQAAFLLELLERLKPLHTIVETSGYAGTQAFQRVAWACDMVYLDIKHADVAMHEHLTGAGNAPILKNLRWLIASGAPFLVRVPLVPGYTDGEENLRRISELLAGAQSLAGVELMPLNPFAGGKYRMLGESFPLENIGDSVPKCPSAADPARIFTDRGIHCRVL